MGKFGISTRFPPIVVDKHSNTRNGDITESQLQTSHQTDPNLGDKRV